MTRLRTLTSLRSTQGTSKSLRGFAVFLALLSIAPFARAQPLADRLPASTLVYIGWSPNASLQTTAAAKMVADERFMAPWRRLMQEFILEMPDNGEDGGTRISAHLPQLLLDAAQCEGCFALLELKQAKHRFNPQSVLMIDLGAKRKSFEEHFKPIHQRLKERVGDRLKLIKLENSWVYSKPDREGKAQLTWGFVGDTFVTFLGDGAEDFVPKLVKGKIDANLKSTPAFVETLAKVPGDSIFTTYLDTKGSLALVRRLIEREGNADLQQLMPKWENLLGELGLDKVSGVAEKTVIEDKQFVTRTLVRMTGPPSGLVGLVAQPAVDEATMKLIPADAMAAAAVRFDPAKTYAQLKTSVINIAGDDGKNAFKELEQGAEGLGLPIKDVLDALGDQWVVYNASSQGGFALTGWTLVCNLRDVNKFQRSLSAVRGMIAKGLGGEGEHPRLRVIDLGEGVKIEYFEFGRWGSPISPAWAVVGDRFVLALYPQIVEDEIRQIKEGGKSLLDNPDYVAARQRTGNEGPMFYASGAKVTENVYPVGLLLVSVMNSFGGGFHEADEEGALSAADLIPSMQRLMQYVGNDAISIKATPDGLLKTRTVGNPLLSPAAWLDSPIVWLALGIPSLTESEDTADRAESAAHLRQIGQAILLYGNENKGKYPPDLATVVKTQDVTDKVLKSPFGPAKGGKDVVLINYASNPMTQANMADVIVAYDQAALEQGEGASALFADGHVDWLPPDVFKRTLEESKKKATLQNAQP